MIRLLLLLLRGKVKEKNKRNNPGGERGLREGEDYSERERKVGYKEEEGEKFVCLCRKLGRKRTEGKKTNQRTASLSIPSRTLATDGHVIMQARRRREENHLKSL